jgi:hypothetical protein
MRILNATQPDTALCGHRAALFPTRDEGDKLFGPYLHGSGSNSIFVEYYRVTKKYMILSDLSGLFIVGQPNHYHLRRE